MEQQEVNNLTAPMNISSNGNSIVAEIGESDHFQHPNQIQDTLLLSSTTPNGSELSDQKSQSLDKRNQEELKQDSEMDKKKISSDNQITVELVQGLPIDQNSHLISAQNNQNTSGAVQEVPPQQSQHRSSESSEPSSTSSDDEKSKQEDDDSDSESNQRIKQEIQNKNQNGKSDNDDNETLSNNNVENTQNQASNSKKFQEDPDSDDEKQAIAQSQKEKEEELKQNDEVQQQRKSEESDDEEEEEEEDEEDEPTISQSSMVVETSPKDRFKRFAEELGRGAYKIVYRGVDHETGREIAWNVINLRRLPRQDRVRIKSEIDLIKKLQHKNIIHFISAWINKQKEQVIFITEMITGGSLRKYVKKIKHPRLKVIKGWCSEILQGLIYLHGQEPHPIIHRDLKCDNIFINSNSGEIRIGDLGLSTPMQHSFTTSVLGTPEFMAPELYEECYGTGVDIYAFGMCVLEMVTLERPYKECQNPAQIYNKVIQGIRPKAMERIEDTEVQDFILQCLKRADQRPTAQELLESRFIQDLENEKNNLEVKVKPPAKQKVPKKKKEPKYQKQGSTILEEEEENNTDEDNTKPKIQAPLQSASVSQSQSVNLSQKQDIPSSSSQQSQMTNEQIKPTSKTSSPNILQKSKMTNILNEDSTPKNDDSVKSALRETLEGQKKGVSSASNVSQKSNKSSPTIEKEKKNTQGQQKIEIKQLDENAKAIVKKGEDDENNEDLKSGSNSNNSMLNNSQNKKKKRNSGSRIKKLDESVSFLKEIDKKKQQKLQERSMANQEPLYQTNIIGQDGVEDEEEDDSTQDKNTENILDELKKDDPQWIEEQQQQQMIFLQQQLQLQQAANATKDKEKNEKLQQQKKQQNPQPTPQQALDHHQQMLDKKKKENMNALLIEKKKNFKEDEPFVTKETPQQQANNSHAPTSGLQTQNSVKDMNQLLQSTNVNSRNSHKKIALANDKDNKSGGPMLQPSHNAEPIGYALKRVSSRDQMVGQQNQLGNEDNPINQQNRMQAIMQPSQSHQNVKLPTQHNSQYIQLTSSLNNENNATSGGVLNRKNANQQNNYSDGMLQNQVQALSNQQTNTAQSTRNNNLDLLANTVNQLEHSQEFDNQSSNPHSDTDENNSDLIIQHKGMNYMDDRGGNNQQHEYQGQPQGMLTPQFETPHTSNGQLKQNHQEYSSSRNLNLGNQTASNNQLGGDQLVHQNSSSYIQQFNHQHQQLAPQNSTLQQQSTQQNNPSTQQNQSNLQVLQTGTSKPQTNKNTDYQLQQNQQQQQLQSQKNQVNNQISSSIQQQQQTQQKLGQQTQQVATQNQQQQKVQPKKLELTKEQSVKAGASSSTHQRPPPSIQQQQLQDLCSAVAFYQSNDSKRLNMTIKIKTPDNGPEKEVTFDFDIRSDTPVGVSQEMVKELQLPSYYIDLIQKKIQSLCQRMQIQGSTPQNQEHRTGGGGTGTGQHGQQQSITNQQQLQQQTTQQQNNLANNNKSGGKSVSNVNQTSQQVINKQKISPTKISKDSAINHFNKLFEGIDGFFQVLQGKGIESLEEVIDAMESTEDEKCFKIEFLNSVYQAKKKYKVKMEEVNKKRQQLIDTKKKVAVSQSAQLLDHSLSSGLVTGTPQNSYASGSVNSGNIQHIQGFGAQSQSSTTTNSKQSMTKQSSTTPAHLIHEQFYYQQHSQQNNNLNNGSNSVTQQSTTHLTPINQSSSQQKRNATSNQGRNDFSQASSSAHTSFKQSSAHNEQNAQNSNYTYSEPNTLANDQFFNQNVPKSDNNITLRTSDKSQSAQQSQKQQTPSTNSQLSSQAKKTLIHLPSRLSGDLYKGNPDMAEEDIINLQNVLSIICTASLQQQWQQQNPGQDSSSITFNHPQLKFDGNFGEKTEKLIIKFQESAGMNPDGIVNEQLWKKLTHCVDKLQSGGKFQIQPSQQQKEQKWTVQQPQHNTTGKSQHQLQQQQQLQPIQTKEKQQSNYNTQLQQQQHQQQQHQQQVTQLTSKQQPPHSPYLYHNKISPLKIQNQASSQSHRQVYSNKDEELEDADYELVMQEVFKGQQDNNGGGNGAGQYY